MKTALKDWSKKTCVVTTALVEDLEYHFCNADPGEELKSLVGEELDVELIQIALPRLYKNRPLSNVALYHELGHFVDKHLNIVKYTELISPIPPAADPYRNLSHRMEYFADLFAASYSGNAIRSFLSNIAGGHPASDTHPATDDRLQNIDDFLKGRLNENIELFSKALAYLKLPELKIRFNKPNIAASFNNIRPYKIRNDEELHGIQEAGWEFLENILNSPDPPWSLMDEFEPDRIVNDLVEKSIRNSMIRRKWANEST